MFSCKNRRYVEDWDAEDTWDDERVFLTSHKRRQEIEDILRGYVAEPDDAPEPAAHSEATRGLPELTAIRRP